MTTRTGRGHSPARSREAEGHPSFVKRGNKGLHKKNDLRLNDNILESFTLMICLWIFIHALFFFIFVSWHFVADYSFILQHLSSIQSSTRSFLCGFWNIVFVFRFWITFSIVLNHLIHIKWFFAQKISQFHPKNSKMTFYRDIVFFKSIKKKK